MQGLHRTGVLLATVVAVLMLSGAATAATVTPVMTGLDNPHGLAFGPNKVLYVTEAGRGGSGPPCRFNRGMMLCYGPTGAISRLRRGVQEKWLTGLPSMAPATGIEAESGPNDISFRGGSAYVTMGLPGTPAVREQLGPAFARNGKLLKVSSSGRIKEIADPVSHEAAFNPDGGLVDSNSYGVLALRGRQIVADAGGNSVLEVARKGHISTLAAFAARPNPLPIGPPFVESVPTAIAQGPDGALYVSEVTGAPFPTGFARIHRIAPDGSVSVYATGLTAVVDLAFAPQKRHDDDDEGDEDDEDDGDRPADGGTLYALQHGSCGPFFACPGSIVRVGTSAPHTVVYAGLSRPSAFTIGPDGAFYVSNRGASPGIGEVLRVQP
jgi:hypothetical protein